MKTTSGLVLTLLLTATVAAGCGQDHTGAAPAKAAPSPAKAAPAAESVVAEVTWSTGPVTVAHTPAVPPVPVVTGIRYAGHPQDGYDRIVLDIQGSGLPGYSVRYVPQVLADGSGKPIPVPGKRRRRTPRTAPRPSPVSTMSACPCSGRTRSPATSRATCPSRSA
jgi:hypothetical protein